MMPIPKKVRPLIILLGFGLIALIIFNNPPESKQASPKPASLGVDVITLALSDVQVVIESYGTVKPRTQSLLLSQVGGQILRISPSFREGGFFTKGDVLVQLDQRDLKNDIQMAESVLVSARQTFSEENARAQQAEKNWQRLGHEGKAPDLVLRKPQLQAAKAKVLSAQASLDKARLALSRTRIVAPYTGRVLTKSVDLGQVVTANTSLAELYAVDYVEIRLPIKNKDLPYITLPEANRFESEKPEDQPPVTIYSNLVTRQSWHGKVVRTEGAFDAVSQQLFVVAQIDDPYGAKGKTAMPLKIGQYVSAKIQGKVLKQALAIPNKAIYQNSYVYIVDKGKLLRKDIEIIWQNDTIAVIKSGLSAGDLLVTTPLGQASSGTRAIILQQDGKPVKQAGKSPMPIQRQGEIKRQGDIKRLEETQGVEEKYPTANDGEDFKGQGEIS